MNLQADPDKLSPAIISEESFIDPKNVDLGNIDVRGMAIYTNMFYRLLETLNKSIMFHLQSFPEGRENYGKDGKIGSIELQRGFNKSEGLFTGDICYLPSEKSNGKYGLGDSLLCAMNLHKKFYVTPWGNQKEGYAETYKKPLILLNDTEKVLEQCLGFKKSSNLYHLVD